MFLEKSESCNFSDDNTIYSCGKDLPKIKEDLICAMKHISKINLTCVQSSDDITLLGVMIDKNLTFKKHIDNLVCKAQYKLHSL